MMPAFGAMELKDRATLTAVLRQTIKAIATALAEDGKLLTKGSSFGRPKVRLTDGGCHLAN